MATVEVTITKDGEVITDVNGVQGKSCTDLTAPLVEALGTVTQDEKKDEYFAVIDSGIEVHNG